MIDPDARWSKGKAVSKHSTQYFLAVSPKSEGFFSWKGAQTNLAFCSLLAKMLLEAAACFSLPAYPGEEGPALLQCLGVDRGSETSWDTPKVVSGQLQGRASPTRGSCRLTHS